MSRPGKKKASLYNVFYTLCVLIRCSPFKKSFFLVAISCYRTVSSMLLPRFFWTGCFLSIFGYCRRHCLFSLYSPSPISQSSSCLPNTWNKLAEFSYGWSKMFEFHVYVCMTQSCFYLQHPYDRPLPSLPHSCCMVLICLYVPTYNSYNIQITILTHTYISGLIYFPS